MDELVSVIIPTYKRSVEYLARAVESVCNQTYRPIEIIVVDDSPDTYEERKAVKAYMASKPGEMVQYFQNEKNMGGSLSRNRGIALARGAYITFLDDDDEYLPDKIETQLRFMLQNNSDLSFENMIMYNTDNRVVDVREHKGIKSFNNDYLLRYHICKHMTGTPTFMFKAEALRKIGGFDDVKMGQEFYLMLKSIEAGLKISYLPECHIKVYKHNDGGISQGKNKITGEKALYQYKKKYFAKLTAGERMYVRFRHWAVLSVAYKRNHMFGRAALSLCVSFFVSPLDFLREALGFIVRIER